jgi:hypothetical protein
MADQQIQVMNKVDHLVGWSVLIGVLIVFLRKKL